jgi:Fanconi anemia group I protein
LFIYAVELLEDEALHPKTASDLIGVLLLEVDMYAAPTLVELSTVFTDCIKAGKVKTGKSLELFPKILSCIALCSSVPLQSVSCGTMEGFEYKSQVLNNVCAIKWHGGSVIHLANMFRDIPMSTEELKFVIDKIIRILREVDLRELPAIVYQLLLLSVKGHKGLVLEGISEFFYDMDRQQKEDASSNRLYFIVLM